MHLTGLNYWFIYAQEKSTLYNHLYGQWSCQSSSPLHCSTQVLLMSWLKATLTCIETDTWSSTSVRPFFTQRFPQPSPFSSGQSSFCWSAFRNANRRVAAREEKKNKTTDCAWWDDAINWEWFTTKCTSTLRESVRRDGICLSEHRGRPTLGLQILTILILQYVWLGLKSSDGAEIVQTHMKGLERASTKTGGFQHQSKLYQESSLILEPPKK